MEIIKEANNKEANKSQKREKKKKSKLREWVDALVFAIIVASFIRWIFMEAFTIPTPSMEGSLLTGDFLFVSKIHYGARTPQTPLQLPLTHQTIWWTDLPSYLTWIQLPIYRIPGLVSVKNSDVVVFNYPPKEDGKPEYPTDLKTNYIKRCMGIAGDTIEVRDLQVYINGKKAPNPPELQYRYLVLTDTRINDKVFQSNDISDYHEVYNGGGYIIFTTPAKINGLKKLSFVKDVLLDKQIAGKSNPNVFPQNDEFKWNEDNFGPLLIPKKGISIQMTKQNAILYRTIIEKYESNKKVELKDDKIWIDGKEITKYTFKQDYYFMMGDNRHNSLDSRFWGFVPGNHIVGKAWFVWLSLDYKKSYFNVVRWNRLFRGIY